MVCNYKAVLEFYWWQKVQITDNCINQPSGKLIAYQLLSRSHKHESNCFLETKTMRQASHFDPPNNRLSKKRVADSNSTMGLEDKPTVSLVEATWDKLRFAVALTIGLLTQFYTDIQGICTFRVVRHLIVQQLNSIQLISHIESSWFTTRCLAIQETWCPYETSKVWSTWQSDIPNPSGLDPTITQKNASASIYQLC